MRKFILLAIFIILLAYAKAEYTYTIFENVTYRDWYFFNLGPAYANSYYFVPTAYINETYYFVFRIHDGYYVYRYDQYGTQVESRGYSTGVWANVLPATTIFRWYRDDVLLPRLEKGTDTLYLYLYRFNVSKYIENSSYVLEPISIPLGVNENPLYLSLSLYETNGSYPSGFIENSATFFTLANHKIYWDFYDADNKVLTLNKMKSFTWDSGLSDVKRAYVRGARGYCMKYSDCLLKVIFEGRSNQKNNEYGVYLREFRKGTFGWEWTDIPLFSTTDWQNGTCQPGWTCYSGKITYWAMFTFDPQYSDKIYVRLIEPDNDIIYFYIQLDSYYIPVFERRINVIDSNAIYPFAEVGTLKNPGRACISGYCFQFSSETYPITINVTNTSKKVPIYAIGNCNGYCSGALCYSFYCYIYINASNSTNSYRLKTCSVYSGYSNVIFNCFTYEDLTKYFPIGSVINISASYSGGPLDNGINEFGIDPVRSYFQVAMSHLGSEAFFKYDDAFGQGFQIPSSYCICTDWHSQGCINATHEKWVRSCSPSGCANEVMYYYNENCSVAVTTTTIPPTTTTVPIAPIVNVSEVAEKYNITGPALTSLYLVSTLVTPTGISLLISIAIATAIAYLFRGTPNAVLIWLGTFLGMLILFAIAGYFPSWILLILIVITGLGVAYFFKGVIS